MPYCGPLPPPLSTVTSGCHLRVLDSLDITSSISLTKLRARCIGGAVDVQKRYIKSLRAQAASNKSVERVCNCLNI